MIISVSTKQGLHRNTFSSLVGKNFKPRLQWGSDLSFGQTSDVLPRSGSVMHFYMVSTVDETKRGYKSFMTLKLI